MSKHTAVKPTDIYLYVPNIIGYLRIIFCTLAFVYCFEEPLKAMIFYALGQGMDAIDGVAARRLNQVSKLGGMLDMLTDRLGTTVLFIVLSHIYPNYWGYFASLIVLDILSHWIHMYATIISGKTTHKGSKNPILNFYYTFPYSLFTFCLLNEAFIIMMYITAFYDHWIFNSIAIISFPVFVGKQFMSVVQLYDACDTLTKLDAEAANRAQTQK